VSMIVRKPSCITDRSITKNIHSTQNGNIISRKDAKDAKKILNHGLLLVLNQKKDFDSKVPFALFAALRETPFGSGLSGSGK
jgi:hypothetical protein